MVGLEHYPTVAAASFVIGNFGLFLNRNPATATELKDVKPGQGL